MIMSGGILGLWLISLLLDYRLLVPPTLDYTVDANAKDGGTDNQKYYAHNRIHTFIIRLAKLFVNLTKVLDCPKYSFWAINL